MRDNPADGANSSLASPSDEWIPDLVQLVASGAVWGEGSPCIVCPGEHLHTNPTRDTHTALIVGRDGKPPFIYCHHQSCAAEVWKVNMQIARAHNGGPRSPSIPPSPEDPERREAWRRRQQIRKMAPDGLDKILSDYQWDLAQCRHASPSPVGDGLTLQWLWMLELFDPWPDLGVWVGDTWDTGNHPDNFRTVGKWREWAGNNTSGPPGPFVCPSLFEPGSVSRSKENVVESPYLVVESDELGEADQFALLRWLSEGLGWTLRAVVFSGRKSYHGWFDRPPETHIESLKAIADGLSPGTIDKKCFGVSQPVRLAGFLRGGTFQELIYLDPPASA